MLGDQTDTKKNTTNCSFTKETESALERVKTEFCRREIEITACLLEKNKLFPTRLPHFCPKDDELRRGMPLGCFKDQKSPRVLNAHKMDLPSVNSVQSCLKYCYKLGHSYGGVEYGVECYCGDSFDFASSTKVDSIECHQFACPGNKTEFCGGLWRIDIFFTGLHTRSKLNLTYVEPTVKPSVKLVFLLTLNGRVSRQVFRLLNLIYSPHHYYYIHVDARQDFLFRELSILERQTDNIRLKQKRFATIWGGASLLTMILDAVKDLFGLFDHWKWDFLLNLSETDFPVLTLEELEAFLTINRHLNFAKSHGRGNDNFLRKQGLEWTFFECENHMWRLAPRKIPENVRIDGGSDWVVLNRQFLDYVTFSDDSLVAGLKEYFRYSLLPAESFFHSVLINSIHCDSLADANLKLTNWKRSQGCKCQHKQIVDWCGCSPNVLRISDMPKLQFENLRSRLLFFARKFEPIIDQRIIEIVENNLITSYHKLSSSTGTPNSFYNVDKRVSLPGYRNFWLNDFHYLDSSPEISIAKKCLLASLASLTLSQERENQMIDASAVPLELNIYTSPSQTFILLYMTLHYEVPKGTKTLILHAESKFAFVNHFNLSITSQKSVNLMQTRFKSLMVGTNFDPKELIFRNYAGALDSSSTPIARIEVLAGLPGEVKLIWLDPYMNVYSESTIELTKNNKIMWSPMNTSGILNFGIWTAEIQHQQISLLQSKFLVFPFKKFLNISAVTSSDENLSPLRELAAQFYRLEDVCLVRDYLCNNATCATLLAQISARKWKSCEKSPWSSRFPDPKSQFNPLRSTVTANSP